MLDPDSCLKLFVGELFVRKRRASFEPMERQFWDLVASGKAQHGDDEWQMKYDALKEEKRKLLKDLLGDAREQTAQKRRPADPEGAVSPPSVPGRRRANLRAVSLSPP